MEIAILSDVDPLLADKGALLRVLEGQDARMGWQHDRSATAEQARALIVSDGVRPEDNAFSRGIIAAREE